VPFPLTNSLSESLAVLPAAALFSAVWLEKDILAVAFGNERSGLATKTARE